jgi:hypothetical protein
LETGRQTGRSLHCNSKDPLCDRAAYARNRDMLKQNGGDYSKAADWQPYAITDGNLVTGQNPASSESTAKAFLAELVGAQAASGFEVTTAPLTMAGHSDLLAHIERRAGGAVRQPPGANVLAEGYQ